MDQSIPRQVLPAYPRRRDVRSPRRSILRALRRAGVPRQSRHAAGGDR